MKKTMKLVMLLVLAVVMSANLSAQISKNIVDTTKQWYNGYYNMTFAKTISYRISPEYISLNGKLYNKVLQQIWDDHHQDQDEDLLYQGLLIREESNKVYICFEQQSDKEFLIYDFDAEIGEHYYLPIILLGGRYSDITEFVVTDVDSIDIEGEYVKRISLSPFGPVDFYEDIQWIEGIGSTSGFIENFAGVDVGNTDLRCCFQNDKILYKSSQIRENNNNCIYYASIYNIKDNNFAIFPNPAKDRVTLYSPYSKNDIFFVNMEGRTVKYYHFTGYIGELDIHDLESGFYAILIRDDENIKMLKLFKQ